MRKSTRQEWKSTEKAEMTRETEEDSSDVETRVSGDGSNKVTVRIWNR